MNLETVPHRLRHIPPGGCARLIPTEHLNGLARRHDSAYRRLHPDAPSTALSTKYDCVYQSVALTLCRGRSHDDYMHYNFGRIHKTLRVTPAMQAGVADHV